MLCKYWDTVFALYFWLILNILIRILTNRSLEYWCRMQDVAFSRILSFAGLEFCRPSFFLFSIKRRSMKRPGNYYRTWLEKNFWFLIFDLTILKWRSDIVITKSKILAWSDRSSLSYELRHDNTFWKTVIFWYFQCSVKFIR